jgi:hypothetical protein
MSQQKVIAKKEVVIKYCPAEEQVADIFTKPLKIDLFYKLKMLDIREAMLEIKSGKSYGPGNVLKLN